MMFQEPRSRNTFWGLIFRLFLLLVAIGGAIYLIYYSQFFSIASIEIQGTVLAPQDQLLALAQEEISQQSNILFFETTNLEEVIKERYPIIQSVNLQKGLPDTIRLIVREREPELIWRTEGEDYLIDSSGQLFASSQEYQEKSGQSDKYLLTVKDLSNLPVQINQKVTTKDWVAFVKEVDQLIIEKTKLEVVKFVVEGTTFDLIALTDKGKILFDTTQPPQDQIRSLKTGLETIKKKQFQYIDLRIRGWIYYK
jgi:cell division septal protein FtsQ